MSSLHHDRLLAEGAAPVDQATTALAPSRTTSTSSSGSSEGKAESTVPTQRQGKAQQVRARRTTDSTARTATTRGTGRTAARGAGATTAAGTIAAKAKAARTATAKAVNSKAVTVTAATARAASAKAATATATATRKAATAARTAAVTKRAAGKTTTKAAGATTSARTGTTTAAATAKATTTKPATKATATKATAAKATAAKPATKAAGTKAATEATAAKPATRAAGTKAATEATAAKPATKAATANPATKAAAEVVAAETPVTGKPVIVTSVAAERATTPRSGGRHRAERPASAQGAADKTGPAAVRPTPYKRALSAVPVTDVAALAEATAPAPVELVVVKEAPGRPATTPVVPEQPVATDHAAPATSVADPVGLVAALARGRRILLTRGPLSPRRRPALFLAAALLGAMNISGASTGAPTEVETATVSHSVSVAEQLGLEGAEPTREIVDVDATERLRELVASRSQRDAERTAAADAQAEADRLAAEAAAEAARPKVVHPVEGARLTSGFGARWGTLHAGIDLAAPMRTPERAVMDGVVLEAGPASGFGLVVYIQHHNGDVTVYGHMDEILVEPGQIVRAGDTIALLGNRGQSTGPHLHFEVHVGGLNGKKVDPLPWLRERGVGI